MVRQKGPQTGGRGGLSAPPVVGRTFDPGQTASLSSNLGIAEARNVGRAVKLPPFSVILVLCRREKSLFVHANLQQAASLFYRCPIVIISGAKNLRSDQRPLYLESSSAGAVQGWTERRNFAPLLKPSDTRNDETLRLRGKTINRVLRLKLPRRRLLYSPASTPAAPFGAWRRLQRRTFTYAAVHAAPRQRYPETRALHN